MTTLTETTGDHDTRIGEKQDDGRFSSRRAYLGSLFLSCISSSAADEEQIESNPKVDRNHNSTGDSAVKSDGGKAASDRTVKARHSTNPLKKYSPASVPGWEVNIIYKPPIYQPPRCNGNTKTKEVHRSNDVPSLLDKMKGLREEEEQANREMIKKSLFWNPVSAVQRLIKNRDHGRKGGRRDRGTRIKAEKLI